MQLRTVIYLFALVVATGCSSDASVSSTSSDSGSAAPAGNGTGETRSGHCDYQGDPYDILNYNCHSAANVSVRQDPVSTGILICNGAPENGDPAHHTYNYKVFPDRTTFYNWGDTCDAPTTRVPPDVHDDDNLTCIARFCGDQFTGFTQRALPPGQQVEEPGPLYCSQNSDSKESCEACCSYRGKFWDLMPGDLRPTDRTFVQFMGECSLACANRFPVIVP